MLRPPGAFATAALLGLAGGACNAGTAADPAGVSVVAAFYPWQFVAERVGGEAVSMTGLTPPGVEAHDLELSPSQVADVAEADLVIYLTGFQPAVDEAVTTHASGAAFEVTGVVPLRGDDGHADDEEPAADEHDHGDLDPHVWLDPDRLATVADALAAELAALDPDRAADFRANAAALGRELAALDAEYAAGLADCARREIVVSHAAFGYLADRYDLTQIAVTGLSPETEPTPQRLAEVVRLAGEHGATTIFFETLASPAVAEVVAQEVGAEPAVLDPIEGLAPDTEGDYLTVMRANLAALRAGLGCP